MPTKKKSTKKPQSTWEWYKSLNRGYKTVLFVLIFAVLGGGFAVYRSFALSFFSVGDNATFSVGVCQSSTHHLKAYVRNKINHGASFTIEERSPELKIYLSYNNIPAHTSVITDYSVSRLPIGTATYTASLDGAADASAPTTFLFNLNRDYLQACEGSK